MTRKANKDKKVSVGIRLTRQTYERLADRAWSEHRTVAALTAIIVEEQMTPREEKMGRRSGP